MFLRNMDCYGGDILKAALTCLWKTCFKNFMREILTSVLSV